MVEHAERPRRWKARMGAVLAIAVMAASGALLAEVGREAQAADARATLIRTAGPAAPAVLGG